MPMYKIASFEIRDIPLIRRVARTQKPILISCGIADLDDIQLAIKTCLNEGNSDITLLQCTSSYPAPIEKANLLTIVDMKKRFDLKVGLSDHTLDNISSIVAVSLGATVIEKHFILDRDIGGPDSSFSLEPKEFNDMVLNIRKTELALGKVDYSIDETKKKNRLLGRSLFVIKEVLEGEFFTAINIKSIRPGYGLHPKYYKDIIGKKAVKNIERGTPLDWSLIESD
jgi:pseudaminic acid synthase